MTVGETEAYLRVYIFLLFPGGPALLTALDESTYFYYLPGN